MAAMLDPVRLKNAAALAERTAEELYALPEESFEEVRTTRYLKELCGRLPVRLYSDGLDTGLIAYLDRGAERTIALRADIDAVSTEAGPKHLCGHNHHTASLCAAMAYLCEEEGLPVNVAFIFQPAEEMTEGAAIVLQSAAYRNLPVKPSAVYGIHNRPELPVGEIAIKRGALMGAKTDFEVVFTGRSGHASAPERCIDPILPGAAFVQAIRPITVRTPDPADSVVCGIYTFRSGDDSINPPEECRLKGTYRSFRNDIQERLRERLETLTANLAAEYRCRGEFRPLLSVPALVNAESLYEKARRSAAAVCGEEGVVGTEPTLATDDFAYFGQQMPAFYYWVGSGEASVPADQRPAWHDSGFCVAKGYQSVAAALLIQSVLSERET